MTRALSQFIPSVPIQIARALQTEFGELEARFARGDWGPAELNGGRFAEGLLRYLEWKSTGSFTAVGTRLGRSAITSRVRQDSSLPEGLRFHVLGCAELLMDVRNKRDVAHLGAVLDVKAMDAHLVMRLASWSLAEIVREESGLPPVEVQQLLDQLSERRLALVEEIGGDLLVVATDLTATERALVGMYHVFPGVIDISRLRGAVQYQNASRFRGVLVAEQGKGIAYISGDACRLTKKGAAWVERNIELRLTLS